MLNMLSTQVMNIIISQIYGLRTYFEIENLNEDLVFL